MHYGVNSYLDEMTQVAEKAYPLLKTFKIEVDHRDELIYELPALEKQLKAIYY